MIKILGTLNHKDGAMRYQKLKKDLFSITVYPSNVRSYKFVFDIEACPDKKPGQVWENIASRNRKGYSFDTLVTELYTHALLEFDDSLEVKPGYEPVVEIDRFDQGDGLVLYYEITDGQYLISAMQDYHWTTCDIYFESKSEADKLWQRLLDRDWGDHKDSMSFLRSFHALRSMINQIMRLNPENEVNIEG